MIDRILRLPAVQSAYGKSRSVIYDEARRGLIPPAVPLGGRLIGWPESEIAEVIRARVAGKTDDEIRSLVRNLVERRSKVA